MPQYNITGYTSKEDMFSSLSEGREVTVTVDDVPWAFRFDSVEREDGSGNCWNIKGRINGVSFKGFLSTKPEGRKWSDNQMSWGFLTC